MLTNRTLGSALCLLCACMVGCSPTKTDVEQTVVPSVTPLPVENRPAEPTVIVNMDRRGPAHVQNLPLPARTIAPGEFCSLYATVVCRKIFACADPSSIEADAASQQFTDEPSCRDALGRFCGAFVLAGVERSVTEGRVRWDGPGFATCFRNWTALGCEPPLGDLPDQPICRQSSVGNVKVGDACTSAFDCAEIKGSEVACTFDGDTGKGICVRLGDDGVKCELSNDCRSDLRCRTGKCLTPGEVGEVCVFADDCKPGLLCPDDTGRCTTGP